MPSNLQLVDAFRSPDGLDLCQRSVGRFGETREPIALRSCEARQVLEDVVRLRLPPDLVVTLVVERQLVLADLRGLGFSVETARRTLAKASAEVSDSRLGPGRLNRSYDRLLTSGEDVSPLKDLAYVTIPSRLCERVRYIDLGQALEPGAIQEGREWERAALAAERTMAEWALYVLLSGAQTAQQMP